MMTLEFIEKFDYEANYNVDMYEYEESMDTLPSMMECLSCGINFDKYMKIFLLYRIEQTKQILNEEEITEKEIQIVNETIEEMIEKFNSFVIS